MIAACGFHSRGAAQLGTQRGRCPRFSHSPLGKGPPALLGGNAGVADLAHAIQRLDEVPRLRPARLGKPCLFHDPCTLALGRLQRGAASLCLCSLALGRPGSGRRRSPGTFFGLLALTLEQGLGIGTRRFGFDDEAARFLDQLRPLLRGPHFLGLAARACQHVGFIGPALLGGPAHVLRVSSLSAALFARRPVLSLLPARWSAIGLAGEPLRDGARGIARVRRHRTHRHVKQNNRTRTVCDRPSRHGSLPDL
jgi:hypothetical protein